MFQSTALGIVPATVRRDHGRGEAKGAQGSAVTALLLWCKKARAR